tara:strand:+ start:166 stop:537 length:372 start_codon:yes stop_codon:yes gene_type:complete
MIKLKNLLKENSKPKKQAVNEVNFDKIKLPSVVNRFLNKFVQSMKGANLNRIKRSAILYKVIDASGMSIQQLMADIQKIKRELQKGNDDLATEHRGEPADDKDNPFDREPSDDELADIEKEFE